MATGPVQGSSREIGRYRLILEQAQGPLGSLWIANGSSAGLPELVTLRPVATQWLALRADVEALAVAARWAQQFEHPHILRALDVVVAEQELATVTEYRDGEVLRDLLAHEQAQGRPAPPGVALRVALDLLDALAHLDAAAARLAEGGRLAHGGLVPDSVLVGTDGHTCLLDVATSVAAQRVLALHKHPEVAAYLSPEQIVQRQADERSAVFSVGVLLWEMLAGRRLFSGPDLESVVERVSTDAIASLESMRPSAADSVPQPIVDIVMRALERDAIERYPTSMAMAQAIRTAARDALGTRGQVGAWVHSLSADCLRGRRDALESMLGIGLGALPPRDSRVHGEMVPSAPAAQLAAPVDLTGTAPELPATRRRHSAGNGARGRSGLGKGTEDESEATIVEPAGAQAEALLDEDASNPPSSRTGEDLLDEADQLPTTLYQDASSDAQERGDGMPGPEVLGEPAPWAREPFFCEQKPAAPRLSSAEATPRDVPLPSWPPKPVRVAPRVASQSGPPPAPAPAMSAGSVAEAPAQVDPTPSVQTAPTRATAAVTLASAPGPVVAAAAAARFGRRKAIAVALLAGLALACAAALAFWLRASQSETSSTRSSAKAPSASPVRPSSRAVVTAVGAAADAGSQAPDAASFDAADATLAQTPDAGAPDLPRAAEERAQAAPGAPTPRTRAPTPRAAPKPVKKFLPSDL